MSQGCHTLRSPDTECKHLAFNAQGLFSKIEYICKLPQQEEVGHIWPTVYKEGILYTADQSSAAV